MTPTDAVTFLLPPDTAGGRSSRYAVIGPLGAVEIAVCTGSGATWLFHYPDNRHAPTADGCKCDLMPSGRCWPEAGSVYPGRRRAAYLRGDLAEIEGALRAAYTSMVDD